MALQLHRLAVTQNPVQTREMIYSLSKMSLLRSAGQRVAKVPGRCSWLSDSADDMGVVMLNARLLLN